MEWRSLEQGKLPEDTVFLVAVDDTVYFTKVKNGKIAMKTGYADAIECEPRNELEYTLYRWNQRNAKPMWAHFHKPVILK
jgi:hypothetical protein